ncbi:MAG: RidA family protein [Elusimicrobiota bacterium]
MIRLKAVDYGTHQEYFMTAEVRGGSAKKLFAELGDVMRNKRIAPIQEIIYGRDRDRAKVLAARKAAYRRRGLEHAAPATYVQGEPFGADETAGVRVWGTRSGSVRTVRCPGGLRGRLWEGAGFRLLYLPEVLGTGSGGAPRQAERMFRRAHAALRAHGFAYDQVVRTWIYLRRLLDWYDDFNRVRNALYRRRDYLGRRHASVLPASTGIQGSVRRAECAMDVLAVDAQKGSGVSFQPVLKTARQGQAFAYRSAFSRAMVLRHNGRKTIHVSGTASINAKGDTVFLDDPEAQSRQTYASVLAILKEQGAGAKDILSATLYCKDRAAYAAWRRFSRKHRLPALPVVAVIGDVCRDDLLIELEAVAAV